MRVVRVFKRRVWKITVAVILFILIGTVELVPMMGGAPIDLLTAYKELFFDIVDPPSFTRVSTVLLYIGIFIGAFCVHFGFSYFVAYVVKWLFDRYRNRSE